MLDTVLGAAWAARRPALLVAAVIGLAGCGGGQGEESTAAEAAALPQLTSAEFYRTYSGLRGAERLERFGDGVEISGRVTRIVDMSDMGGRQLWLAAEGPARVTVRFADSGGAAAGVRVGETVSLRCSVAGAMPEKVSLSDCELLSAKPPPASPGGG